MKNLRYHLRHQRYQREGKRKVSRRFRRKTQKKAMGDHLHKGVNDLVTKTDRFLDHKKSALSSATSAVSAGKAIGVFEAFEESCKEKSVL